MPLDRGNGESIDSKIEHITCVRRASKLNNCRKLNGNSPINEFFEQNTILCTAKCIFDNNILIIIIFIIGILKGFFFRNSIVIECHYSHSCSSVPSKNSSTFPLGVHVHVHSIESKYKIKIKWMQSKLLDNCYTILL